MRGEKTTTQQTHSRGCLICRHMVALICRHHQNKRPISCLEARKAGHPCGPQGALWEYMKDDDAA